MIDEADKYRAQMFQIAGLSCFSPIGKFFIDIKNLGSDNINFALFSHIIISISIAYFGIILLYKGFRILKKEK